MASIMGRSARVRNIKAISTSHSALLARQASTLSRARSSNGPLPFQDQSEVSTSLKVRLGEFSSFSTSPKKPIATLSVLPRTCSTRSPLQELLPHLCSTPIPTSTSTSTSTPVLPASLRFRGAVLTRWPRSTHRSSSQPWPARGVRNASTSSKPEPEEGRDVTSPSSTPTRILDRIPKLRPTTTTHENIYTLPNFLTFTRLLAAPAVGYYILHSQPIAALSLFFYAGITDAVDGYLARRYGSTTVVGTVIDPMADKALMTIAVVCLTIQGILPLWLSVIVLGRDVALAISAIYFRYISLPEPKTFARYWDFSLPSAEVHPTEISKINTFLQLLLVGNAMLLPVLPETMVTAWNLSGVFEGWCYLVAGTTVWSGLSYIGNREAVKILSREEGEERKRKAQEGKGSKK